MHSDKCKELIQANSPTFSLATEFIESIDPDRDEKVWQRFQSPEDILPELRAWLGGEENPTSAASSATAATALAKPLPPGIKPASQLVASSAAIARPDAVPSKADAALQRTKAWLADPSTQDQIRHLAPSAAAEIALQKFHAELAG